MKTILLINPYFNFFEQSMLHRVVPPLELVYILTMLKEKKVETEIIDANALRLRSENLFWNNIKANIFVFTSASLDSWQCPPINLTPLVPLINKLRENNPDAKFIIIGPHGTMQPEKIQRMLGDVFIIKGEPEHATVELIMALFNNKPLSKIPNLYNQKKGIDNAIDHTKFNLLPMPVYDKLPMKYYKYSIMGKNFTMVEASRGCNYKCGFCLQIMYPPKPVIKCLKRILDELEYLETSGIKNVEFIDLEFCFNKNHAKSICKGILQRKIKLNWCISTRVDSVDKKLLNLFKKAGCSLIHYGIETGNPQILTKMQKCITLQKVKETFALTEKAGIKTLAHFIFGSKGEISQNILETIKFAKDLNPYYSSFALNVVYPCTPNCSQLHKKAYSIYDAEISLAELKRLQRRATLSFYIRPRYIYKLLKSVSSVHDFQILWDGFKDYFIPLLLCTKKLK